METTEVALSTKGFFAQDNVKKKFQELLGKKAQGFITSVLQIVASNDLLVNADPASVYQAAALAATLDLPLNNSLGFAYIVPYNQKQKNGQYKVVAQFQVGYKAFIQLAQRSGQFKTISATPIYEGQITENNPLTGYVFDFSKRKSDTIIGYAAYFSLLNGFEKTLYMDVAELKRHGKNFSQTFKKGFGLWETNFEAMAIKTVIKLLLSKYAPLSIEMQKVVVTDQSVINNADTQDVTYVDNEVVQVDKESERIALMISDSKNVDDLESLKQDVPDDLMGLYDAKMEELKHERR